MRKTPLTRKTPLRQRKPISKSVANGKYTVTRFDSVPDRPRLGRQGAPIPQKIRDALERRSRGRCEAQFPGCTGVATDAHHRKLRAQGGLNDLETLVHLCQWCHTGVIHRNTGWAYEHGWLVRRHDDPAFIPILPGSPVALSEGAR
jgi:hypothetical protein